MLEIKNSKILIVDDTKVNIDILVAALKNDYRISVASDGASALEQASANPPDLVLLDIMMPDLDGYEVCSKLKSDPKTVSVPVIFITALDQVQDKSKGFSLGAVDYITKPFHIVELKARVRTHLALKHAMEHLANQNHTLDIRVRERTRELQETQLEIIYRLSRAAEFRDNETGMHIKRISHMSRALASALDSDEETMDLIFHASPMHDIGKIGIPDRVLLKPGRLDPDEWEIMKTHTTIGADILSGHHSLLLKIGQLIALTHHEKWDGSGYPQGLSEYAIPLAGRIVSVCDVFDALTSVRPYKDAWPLDQAIDWIKTGGGHAFDPKIVDAFLSILPGILQIKEQYGDETAEGGSENHEQTTATA